MKRSFCLVLVSLGLAACDSSGRKLVDGGTTGPLDFATTIDPTVDGGTSPSSCSDSAKLVYLVDSNTQFLSFEPSTLTFTTIASLSCPSQFGATPFSMGVDRTPSAWVLYQNSDGETGDIFKVSPTTGACQATSYTSGQSDFALFGMGFASNSSGSSDETLYIGGGPSASVQSTSAQFATLSFPGLTVSQKGSLSGWPELTGTGTGDLWAFFPSATAPRIAKINKTSGAELQTIDLPSLTGTPMAWAFASWGGDFWIFLQRSNDSSTNVYHVKTDGTTTKVLSNTGRTIVGAGVSTCAPTTIQ